MSKIYLNIQAQLLSEYAQLLSEYAQNISGTDASQAHLFEDHSEDVAMK